MHLLTSRNKVERLPGEKDFSSLPGASGEKQSNSEKRKSPKGRYDTGDIAMEAPGPHVERADKTWHLNLRCKDAHKPANGWRRHFTRPFQTFDHLKSNLADDAFRRAYVNSECTPSAGRRWRPDRQKGHWGGILPRDDDANFTRSPGCEGAQAGLWLHLLQARHERAQLAHETTLREACGDESGARVNDNRSEGCIVEMLGKKNWRSPSPRTPDLRLHHLDFLKAPTEPDEDNRKIRVSKTPRRDAALCSPTSSPSPGMSSPSPVTVHS